MDDTPGNAETMLVPANAVTGAPENDFEGEGECVRPRMAGVRFGEDMEDEAEALHELFGDEDDDYESEIDQAYIQEMMMPDPNYTYTVYEELPQRKTQRKGVLEKQFENAMRQFEVDGVLEEDDARVKGPMKVEQVDEGNWHIDEATYKVMPSKQERIELQYGQNTQELRELTRQYLKQNAERLNAEDEEEKFDLVKVPNKKDKWDCETILSTYSNLYNHPTVIQPATHRDVHEAKKRLRRRNIEERQQQHNQAGGALQTDTTERVDTTQFTYIPQRTKNETAEEKRERRKLVKQAQAQRRQMKKEVTLTYRAEGIRQGQQGPPAKMISLS